MVKCSKAEVRRLSTALRWKIPAAQRQRIQMVLLRESGIAQPAIAAAIGVSLSTVNRAPAGTDESGMLDVFDQCGEVGRDAHCCGKSDHAEHKHDHKGPPSLQAVGML